LPCSYFTAPKVCDFVKWRTLKIDRLYIGPPVFFLSHCRDKVVKGSCVMSVRPVGTAVLTSDGFSWNLYWGLLPENVDRIKLVEVGQK
jgi:hypothetical protein